ncbi:hypothetical protein M2165_001896 [Variovorax sp. TBS-050B]|uniref:protealysin inhibitor emfourin n=1 Tax=Variovorax sp. TBS-050B TaxID=2940551 RepID=UPI002475B547|nr:protealysin inhibitor emfourin [Variovorax sp. TBS-050B]MDH6592007.1 hypothetical protein [Variovorax sp. TBS-050B]
MIQLPPLDQAAVVRVTREGGIAYVPGLSRPRSYQLGNCSEELRAQIDRALQSAAPHAGEAGAARSPGGDQRVYRVEVVMQSSSSSTAMQSGSVSFEVPEAEAPEALVHLWKDAAER